MKPGFPQSANEGADEAINRVLQAEHQAQDSIRRHEADARRIVAEARLRARRIHERVDARVSRLRGACQRWSARITAQLQGTAEEIRTRPVQDDVRRGHLDEAVERLAAELTGGES